MENVIYDSQDEEPRVTGRRGFSNVDTTMQRRKDTANELLRRITIAPPPGTLREPKVAIRDKLVDVEDGPKAHKTSMTRFIWPVAGVSKACSHPTPIRLSSHDPTPSV